MSNTSRNTVKSAIALVISGALIAAAVWVVLNRQYALDVVTNVTFQPSSTVEAVTERTKLTGDGKFAFYATRPEVLTQEAFNEACPRQEPGSPILGCYTTDDRIYVYDVTDAKLDGIKEVTAAHEVLHAVWQRTSQADKDKLAIILKDAYVKNADATLKSRMEYYERTEPGEFVNELHSILGTEVHHLGDELEAYYEKYFDRETVLALHDNYSSLYVSLSTRADTIYNEMKELSETIDTLSSAYNQESKALSADVNDFNQRARNGSFSSTAAFNAERSALTQRSNALEVKRQEVNATIAQYNVLYEEYKKIGSELEVLNQSMDSYKNLEEVPAV